MRFRSPIAIRSSILKTTKGASARPILFGIEQPAEGAFQRVVAQGGSDRVVLHLRHDVRQGAVVTQYPQ